MQRKYILKKGIEKDLLKDKTNRYIAEQLGVSETYVSLIKNRKKNNISKLMAYGFCKAISPDLEIENLFEIM